LPTGTGYNAVVYHLLALSSLNEYEAATVSQSPINVTHKLQTP